MLLVYNWVLFPTPTLIRMPTGLDDTKRSHTCFHLICTVQTLVFLVDQLYEVGWSVATLCYIEGYPH